MKICVGVNFIQNSFEKLISTSINKGDEYGSSLSFIDDKCHRFLTIGALGDDDFKRDAGALYLGFSQNSSVKTNAETIAVEVPDWMPYDVDTNRQQLPFSIFPNPSMGSITVGIYSATSDLVEIEIFDLLGRSHLNWESMVDGFISIQLDGARLLKGTYLSKAKIGDEVFSEKIVIL